MGEGVVTWFIAGNLVVYIDKSEGLAARDDVKYHGRGGGHGMGEVINHRDGFVDLGFDVSDDEAAFVWGVFGVVYLPLVVRSDAEYVGAEGVGVGTVDVHGAVPWFLDQQDVSV